MGKAPSHGLEKGVVVDIGETTASIKRAIEEAENMADVRIERVYAGIAGKHIQSINNSGTVSISRDNRVITVGQYIVDGQEGITDPVGMTGTRLEVDVHIVTGSMTAVHNIYRCVENLGLEIERIVLQPLASSYAVLTEAEKELGVVLMDIGGGTTDIAIFRRGDIWFSKSLPIAGEQITNDITVGLKVEYQEAERIKREIGLPRVDEVSGEERFEITTIGGEKKSVSKRKLAKIIEPRLEELFDLAMGEIEDAGYRDLIPAGIVLTGGTALLKGLPEFVQERYKESKEFPYRYEDYGLGWGRLRAERDRDRERGRPKRWWVANGRQEESILAKVLRWLNRVFRGAARKGGGCGGDREGDAAQRPGAHPGHRGRRRGLQRRQPHDEGQDQGRGVRRRQHRRPGARGERGASQGPNRAGRRHGLPHGRDGRRDGDGRLAGDRPPRPRGRGPHRGHRDEALLLRGPSAGRAGQEGHRGAAPVRRHPHHHPERPPAQGRARRTSSPPRG